nr:LOW QUALITY PROTEIN: putative uncharacterized protein ZNF436-AS1 [Saimiri boliviensis boliviensis]
MLAVPVWLKVGSQKPEWGTNRLTSCPSKDPLDRRLQNLRDRERIPNHQRTLRPGVRKDSREHWQVPEVSDPQVDLKSVDLQTKPRYRRQILKTKIPEVSESQAVEKPQARRQIPETTEAGQETTSNCCIQLDLLGPGGLTAFPFPSQDEGTRQWEH